MIGRVRIWFAGTGSFARECLENLTGKIPVDLVVTAEPKRSGRGLNKRETPVGEAARHRDLTLHHTKNFNTDPDLLDLFSDRPPLLMLVVDFAQIIGEPFLSLEPLGCLNIHPSLLPKYRGAAPVQRAILDGKETTGVTLFRLVPEMDSGPIALQEEVPLPGNASAGEMLEVLAGRGSQIFLNALKLYGAGALTFRRQPHEQATYAPKISKRESELSWDRPAQHLHNMVRALNPVPGAFVIHRGQRLKIWRTQRVPGAGEPGRIVRVEKGCPVVACRREGLLLLEVQREGKGRQPADAWFRGTGLKEGDHLK